MTETASVENVVAEHHGDAVLADEFFADDERLGKSVGMLMNGIGKLQTELVSRSEQTFKLRGIVRC